MATPSLTCACGCGEVLPSDRHPRMKFLNPTHRRRQQQRRYLHKKRVKQAQADGDFSRLEGTKTGEDESRLIDEHDFAGQIRRGPMYEQFVADGLAAEVWHGRLKQVDAAERFGTSKMNVSRWMKAYAVDMAREERQRRHSSDEETFADLAAFTERFFSHLEVPDFHREWVGHIDRTVDSGGRLLLLAPQRHGKSEMLIRYCIMRICRDPNVRILWVSKTVTLAEKMVGYVRQVLENNEELRDASIGPGKTFVPSKGSGLPWTNGEFTVACRSEVRKTPTMTAIGVGGTILGLDADLVVLDDPQDRARCQSPSYRASDVEWMFTDFMSRKEEDTGVAFIMSRQHIDDLPGHVIRDHLDDWDVRIYRAHDPACTVPEKDFAGHRDCVLWPEKRSWEWLYHQKQANLDHFSRNYMNDPKADGMTYITADELTKIEDRTRRVGELPTGGGRLVVGVDPAEAKPVAATLWCWDGIQRHLIDAREFSASVVGLREVLAEWPARYGVREIAFEKNMAQSWLLDEEVKRLRDEQGLKIHHHYTSRINKQSNAIGPVSMFQRMRCEPPEITIPGAPGDGQERIERVKRSWLSFDPDMAGHKHADDDLVMASWFPQLVIDSWEKAAPQEMIVEFDSIGTGLL